VTEQPKNHAEKPLGVAIVVCEKVITEAKTGNKTLVSTFNNIQANGFPCKHPSMAVYVALTNGTGEKHVLLVFKKADKNIDIMRMGGKVGFENPNHVVELIFNLRNCIFPEAGLYAFEIWADEEFIFDGRFNVVLKD
jgi:hypothetical protein